MNTRRTFIAGLGAAAAWPLAARAQQPKVPVVGWLGSGSDDAFADMVAAFGKGMDEAGFVEGRNVAIEYRWAEGQYDRLPALAADLVRRPVNAIFASATVAARAARMATSIIPIVFTMTIDPVAAGLVASLARPGGNVTGVTFLIGELVAKQLGLLHELVPSATRFAMLVNPGNSAITDVSLQSARTAASTLKVDLRVLSADTASAIDVAFASLDRQPADALLVSPDPFFSSRFDQIVSQTVRRSLPAICGVREFVEAGGLMTYGASQTDAYHQAGLYVARVLRGEKAADLPVMQSSKFELIINLKTANALGITVSNTMQLLADEVIE
jgi:putative tryptophan/tyrosine transport system substrate-binding protein